MGLCCMWLVFVAGLLDSSVVWEVGVGWLKGILKKSAKDLSFSNMVGEFSIVYLGCWVAILYGVCSDEVSQSDGYGCVCY